MKKAFIKIVLSFILGMAPMIVQAQYATAFYLTDLEDVSLKQHAQDNISKLLTQLNTAYFGNRSITFSGIEIALETQNAMSRMWQNAPFRCGDTEVVERCLNMKKGILQVRNIPLLMKSVDEKEQYQEAVIGFDSKGRIIDFHLAISANLYIKVLKHGQDVTDFRYRQIILDYVEQFRTAYNTKDLGFLEQIYSDDALIITGKVIKSVPTEINNYLATDKVIYTKQSKKEYLQKLGANFKANKRINVLFDDIKLMKHPAKEGYYGVTLKQGYSSDNYSDVGYLFLLWDFTNPDAPKIHVRTWQPEMLNATTPLPEEEIFTCGDFEIR